MKRFNWNVSAGNDNVDEQFDTYKEARAFAKSIKDKYKIVNIWKHDNEFDYENCGECENEWIWCGGYENGKLN